MHTKRNLFVYGNFIANNFGAKNRFVLFYRNMSCRLKIKTKFVNVLVTAKSIQVEGSQ